ncbi:hypothetical protein AAIR98_001213 [Elusimicrobium simillimum]|uniref:CPBP family intramembrane glutamic endopeptidase n=1 Tax=Elusimicrobium simillimum TaxID=3143438 RepID=UPI003C705199
MIIRTPGYRPAPNPAKEIWKALTPAMLLPFIAAVFYFNIFDGSPLAKHIYGASKIFVLLWPIIAMKFIIKRPFDIPVMLRFDAKNAALGLAWGLLIFGGAVALWCYPPFAQAAKANAGLVQGKAANFGVTQYYLAYSIFISFFHSLLEEYYWRWFVCGRLLKVVKQNTAVIVSAIAFALHHFIICNFYFPLTWALFLTFWVAVGGVIFNLLYKKGNTLISPWLAHMGADLAIMYVGYKLIF